MVQPTKQAPKMSETVNKGVTLGYQEDAVVIQAAAEWGANYSKALRRIINEWAAAQTQTPGE